MNFKFIASLMTIFTIGGLLNMGLFRFINTFELNAWLNLFLSGGLTFFISGVISTMNSKDSKNND